MANIRDKTAQIRDAVYGKDVRESIAAGIEAISDQQDNYEQNLTGRQSSYETKVTGEWSDYKKNMDEDESTRKLNEQIRESNESIRQSNENTRQQNEIIRQNNETDRKANETARETAFAGMQHVDANLELSTARGSFENLNARLNDSEGETLPNKELITITHNLDSYPNVRCICGYYGAGMIGAGDGPAGLESYLINIKVGYPDTNNIKIYVPTHYLIKSPVIQKLSDGKYILASNDSTEAKSILIDLMEVA